MSLQPAAESPAAPDLSGYSLQKQITVAISAILSEYSGGAEPTEARTVIRGSIVTTSMTDVVGALEANLGKTQPEGGIEGVDCHTRAGYERAVIAAVCELTDQRVTSLTSTHDRESDVAVERFSLETGRRARRRRSARAAG
jgi:hypothetical protein